MGLFSKKPKEVIPMVETPVSVDAIVSLSDNLAELKNLAEAVKEQTELLIKHQQGFCLYLEDQDIDTDAAETLEMNLTDVEGYLEDIVSSLSDAEKEIAGYKY